MTTATHTIAEAALLAAATFDRPFTPEDLAVAAWKANKQWLGLAGYEDKHPNNKTVEAALYGVRGLVARKLLIKVGENGQKLYRLTLAGRNKVAMLRGEPVEEPSGECRELPLALNAKLTAMLDSRAWEKISTGRKDELAFADACLFWGISQETKGDRVDTILAGVETFLNGLDVLLADEDRRLSTGRVVTAGDVRALRNLHRYLAERFEKLLKLLRSRR